ncbi:MULTISPECIES: hypothetical protein [Cellulophaga]|uniref:Uncharacterized protein n=2 Tax=Cellulophaga baltica TaxID=76594 RepID=A0A1G7G6F7_9FLAO|nr:MULTISPECIES: hypothetical protein [Cellulophaga]WFO16405.1 hypothetical protein M601_000840 [Cellulophaga baltica 4]AIY14742.1 hypothetical protein M667_17085 [Cellulophaga baltica NN016038]AIZ43116.1 hypothetical protein M666_17105 [Cellulophaga baltica 18]KGK31563.1 hypothetical protein EL45_04150 [Cellulophaga sp. E6(2014)]MBA6315602.1 hypothetical protein [Cellulophaga baltica]
MTKLFIIFSIFYSFLATSNDTEWDVIYTKASYALNHTKKALSSNNFDHQRYYSEKALEAYLDISEHLETSNDDELKLKIEHTISDLEHAVDAPDWDRGRFYSKRVHANTQELITELDLKAMAIAEN